MPIDTPGDYTTLTLLLAGDDGPVPRHAL